MKIGILSLVLHSNYGGILQSYALQTVLERMGYEVVVFTKDLHANVGLFRYVKSIVGAFVRNHFIRNGFVSKSYRQLNKERDIIEQFTKAFIDKYIHTRVLKKLDAKALKDIDAAVVGSDQVWRPRYFKDAWDTVIEDAYLQFAGDIPIKRIAYAVSFGTDDWEYDEEETTNCSRLIKTFKAVSVREESGIQLCKDKLGMNQAIHVLDPTLLLCKDDYIHLVKKFNTTAPAGDMMCYVLDMNDEKKQLINHIAKEKGLTPFYMNSKYENDNAIITDRIQPPVEQWLRGFIDCDFVVTDSFHACVFSIIFNKPFIVVGNKRRGMARFQSLLRLFSLDNNLISSVDEYKSGLDYTVPQKTYSTLEKLKKQSMFFLIKAVES